MFLDEPEKSFAKRFVSSLKREDWEFLWRLFAEQKAAMCEAEDLDGAKLFFPEKIIENGKMVGYHEILPFGTGFNLTKTEARVVLEDSYCLKLDCTCTDAALDFIALAEGLFKKQTDLQKVIVNYKTKKWDFSKAHGKIPLEKTTLQAAVEREWPNIYTLLKKRHQKMKALYRRFKEAKQRKTDSVGSGPAASTSRNAPCPCGSGKKYKRCCGRTGRATG